MSSTTKKLPYTLKIVALLFFYSVSLVHAEVDTTTEATSSPERQEILHQQEERRMALQVQLQERISNLVQNVMNRFHAVVFRMDNIIGRLESRIEKLDAQGIDTAAAKTPLAAAKRNLDAAKEILQNIGSVEAAMTSATPREAFNTIRAQFVSARDTLKMVREALHETVALLIAATQHGGTNGAAPSTTPPAQ